MMAFYSESELKDILVRLSQESSNVRFIKFERLGVKPELVSEDNNDSSVRDVQNEATLYDCSVCKKKLISAHLLDLHVAEYHDSYFELEKDKKPMFACYLEECKHLSATPEARKDHCIKNHKFPHDFRFDKVVNKKKALSTELMDTSDSIESATSSKLPKLKNFHFGHKSQKVFSGKKTKKDAIATMNDDLKSSLPDVNDISTTPI